MCYTITDGTGKNDVSQPCLKPESSRSDCARKSSVFYKGSVRRCGEAFELTVPVDAQPLPFKSCGYLTLVYSLRVTTQVGDRVTTQYDIVENGVLRIENLRYLISEFKNRFPAHFSPSYEYTYSSMMTKNIAP